ncbi:MAG: helix-turn-helix domain-containing protein [Altibacter sp.]|nr:helix-turn-helix domain-containing protein [Altibacter sp.]
MRLPLLILSLLALTGSMLGQSKLPQNLHALEDEALLYWFDEVGGDSITQERIARVYLERARMEKDTIKMARGYDRLARIFHPEKNLQFADSVIELTKHEKHITYPALGYILRGYNYSELGNLVQSTKEYFNAYLLSKEQNNLQQQIYILDVLISSKSVWGNKEEALDLQRKRHKIVFSKEFYSEIIKSTRKEFQNNLKIIADREKLSSWENFVFCFINLVKVDSARFYSKKAYNQLEKYNGLDKSLHLRWLLEADIDIEYLDQNYDLVIKKGRTFLDLYPDSSPDTKFNIYMLNGLSLIERNDYRMGIKNLLKADSIYKRNVLKIYPADRKLFEKLYDYSSLENNIPKQIEYLNSLLFIDSICKKNYQYFEPQIIKNVETPRLLAEKEKLINELQRKNEMATISNWAIAGLLILSTLGFFYYFNRQLLYKKRFEKLVAYSQNEATPTNGEQALPAKPSNELVENILQSLVAFERNKEYLSQKISLGYLSKRLDTNSKYLSQVINMEKDKSFTQYINDLRVTYAFKKLAADPVFRKYTIMAIAGECGFKTGESFSKAFYKKYGIYPSYYLKSLEKKESPD